MSTKAYSYIVKLLSSRDYSEYKIREKLKLKEFPAIEIEDALNEIKSRGFLRETVYNESRIRSLMNKNYSPNYILQKLNQEHLDTNIEQIVDVFNENQVSSLDQIEWLIKKKIQRNTEFDFDGQNKILRYLLSKGHELDESRKCLNTIINELNAEQ